MKKLLVLGNLLFFALVPRAQSDYFLFIQSENNQPYYVQTDGKTLSSSAIGHLIISGLSDSMYTLNIGFPKNQFPEQIFQVRINKRDAGYQLKNMGSGWVLFNMQTLQLINAQPVESKKQTVTYGDVKKTDNFSTLMAGLVNDSAVLYTSIAKVEPVKESSKKSISDTPIAKTEVVKQENLPKKDSPVANTEIVKQEEAVIIKDGSVAKTDGKQLEILKNDTALIKTDVARQEEILKKDSAVTKMTTAKQEENLKKDTLVAKTETVKQAEDLKKDKAVNSTIRVPLTPAQPEQEKAIDSLAETQVMPAEMKSKESKPLIVWFSETKTSAGTELVFFDMSSADRIDTIKMLILNDDIKQNGVTKKENVGDTSGGAKTEDQKSGAGKLIGKIFGKKDNSKVSKNDKDGKKVTTIENTKPVDSSVAKNNADKKKEDLNKKEAESIKDDEKKNADQKSGTGKFFAKIFGKKNNSVSSKKDTGTKTESAKNTSTIKVTTVENTKPVDSSVAKNNVDKKKEDINRKEAESIKDDEKKNADQKSGTGKFFAKIFGKRNNSVPSKKDTGTKTESAKNTSTIKVTTVENPKSIDPPVAQNNEGKSKQEVSTKEAERINDEEKKENQKTGAGKFIEKIFGKKNNSNPPKTDTVLKVESPQNTSSIKVTTVDKGNSTPSTSAMKNDSKSKPVLANSDCREFASDYDVDKLRVRMLGEKDADGQVTEARKFFKTKCFSTQQIKSLSTLFRTDEGKYKLFDAAYPFVSDSNNFKDLARLLSEEYYINRFKAMVRM